MPDLHDQLRQLVDNPATGPLPLADVAARAGRRRARRRRAQVVAGTMGALALVGLAIWWPMADQPDTVTGADLATEGDGTTSSAEETTVTSDEAGTADGEQAVEGTVPPSTASEGAGTTEAPEPTVGSGDTEPADGAADRPEPPAGAIRAADFDEAAGAGLTNGAVMVQASGYLAFPAFDLSGPPATRFEVHLASAAGHGSDGLLEVRLHRVDNAPIVTIPLEDTGGWDSYTTLDSHTSAAIEGTYDIYITFTSSQAGDLASVDWFRFVP